MPTGVLGCWPRFGTPQLVPTDRRRALPPGGTPWHGCLAHRLLDDLVVRPARSCYSVALTRLLAAASGKRSTSRMASEPVSSITRRSIPMPQAARRRQAVLEGRRKSSSTGMASSSTGRPCPGLGLEIGPLLVRDRSARKRRCPARARQRRPRSAPPDPATLRWSRASGETSFG